VISRARHLQEERLFDAYMAASAGAAIDPPVAEHLADCAACAARYADLGAFMDTLREEGHAEADAVFTPERLRAQQQQIARRIAQVGRPARVISFPSRIVRRTIGASGGRTVPRWTAAAAAAGLFIGVALGASYEWTARSTSRSTFLARDASLGRLASGSARGGGSARASSPADIAADEAFLSELEFALERPHTRELQAFDALTPHFREIKDTR
jgi:hypothetical protein